MLSFTDYVKYFSEKNYILPGGKDWIDHIRSKSNEANHEMVIMDLNIISFAPPPKKQLL